MPATFDGIQISTKGAAVLGTNPFGVVGASDLSAAVASQPSFAAFSAYRTTNVAAATSWTGAIGFQVEEFDSSNYFDVVTGVFNPKLAGIYRLSGQTATTASVADKQCAIYKNGVAYKLGDHSPSAQRCAVTTLIYMNGTTDYADLRDYSSVARTLMCSITDCYFQGEFVGAGASVIPVALGAFSAYKTVAQTPVANTWTKVTLGGEDFDVSNWFDAANSRFQPQQPGVYRFNAQLVAGSSPGQMQLALYKNGVRDRPVGDLPTITVAGSGLVYLNGTTDYVELWVIQSTAAALSIGALACFLQGEYVGQASSAQIAPRQTPALGANLSPLSGYAPPCYWKSPDGTVFLEGIILATAAVAANATLFVLPVGYRAISPVLEVGLHSVNGPSRWDHNSNTGSFFVPNALPNGAWFNLTGISFKAA